MAKKIIFITIYIVETGYNDTAYDDTSVITTERQGRGRIARNIS